VKRFVVAVVGALAVLAAGVVMLDLRDDPHPEEVVLTAMAVTGETAVSGQPESVGTHSEPERSGGSGDAIELLSDEFPLPEKSTVSGSTGSGGPDEPGPAPQSDAVIVEKPGGSVDYGDSARAEPPVDDDKGPEPLDSDPVANSDPVETSDSAEGPTYTWQDGDRTLQVRLQPDLTVGEDGAIVEGEPGNGNQGRERGRAATIRENAQPVFRSDTGALMTLPGGVVLALDPDWDETQTDGFFAENQIPLGWVSESEWLPNVFFIETNPGFPSLDLANALAGRDGVVYAIPNWSETIGTR